MTPLNSFKRYCFSSLAALFIFAIISGCTTKSSSCKGCDTGDFKPNVNLKFIDPNSKQDIFFGEFKRYTPNQIVVKHVQKGILDSLPSLLKIDTVQKTFNVDLLYQNDVDTLSIQVGPFKPQLVYLGTGMLTNCCTKVIVTSVNYGDKLLFKAPEDPTLQAKLPNLVTIPLDLK